MNLHVFPPCEHGGGGLPSPAVELGRRQPEGSPLPPGGPCDGPQPGRSELGKFSDRVWGDSADPGHCCGRIGGWHDWVRPGGPLLAKPAAASSSSGAAPPRSTAGSGNNPSAPVARRTGPLSSGDKQEMELVRQISSESLDFINLLEIPLEAATSRDR